MTIETESFHHSTFKSLKSAQHADAHDEFDLGVSPESIRMVGSALAINEALPGLVSHESTAMLLDINNLYRRAADTGFRIDYVRLRDIFSQRCDLRYCSAFSAIDRQNPKSNKWANYMQDKGYDVISKDLKRYTNREGKLISKGNMDIEIALAARDLSPGFDHVIIGTCDGDFVPLIERLKKGHHRKVSVLGISSSDWTGMSSSLINAAHHFYDMSKIEEHIAYSGPRE